MKTIHIRDEYITLGQLLKLANMVGSGSDSKMVILDGLVKVNGEIETRRGKKLRTGDIVEFDNESVVIG